MFTSDLLNIYDIPGPTLGHPSTNNRPGTRKVVSASTFRERSRK